MEGLAQEAGAVRTLHIPQARLVAAGLLGGKPSEILVTSLCALNTWEVFQEHVRHTHLERILFTYREKGRLFY